MSLTSPGLIQAILYVAPYHPPVGQNMANSSINITAESTDVELVNKTLVSLAVFAQQLGWSVLNVPRTSPNGVPYLKEMFYDAAERFGNCTFYGYSNGDVLYTDGLMRTLHAVEKVCA